MAGDIHNALLSGIGYNLKMRFNQIKVQIVLWFDFLILIFVNVFFKINLKTEKAVFNEWLGTFQLMICAHFIFRVLNYDFNFNKKGLFISKTLVLNLLFYC